MSRAVAKQVGKGIFCQNGMKGIDAVAEDRWQVAIAKDAAAAALDQIGAGLGRTDNLGKIDLARRPRQSHTTTSSARGFDEAQMREVVRHLQQMGLRNPVQPCDFGNLHKPGIRPREVDQQSERIVGMLGKLHG